MINLTINESLTKKEELEATYDYAKSFYGKAHVIKYYNEEGNTVKVQLQSYNTIVAEIRFYNSPYHTGKENVEVFGTYSNTTLRHIKEFLNLYGYEAETKKQIEQDYIR